MKDTRNPPRHRSRHPGVRRNCWEHRGCTWRDTQLGRGECSEVVWSDPTFGGFQPSNVVSEALKLLFKKDEEFKRWAGQHANGHSKEQIQGEALTKTA